MADNKLKIDTVDESFKPIFTDQETEEEKEKTKQSENQASKVKNVSTLRKMAKFKGSK